MDPLTPTHLWALLIAGAVGAVGNELAAVILWRAGRRLDSAALSTAFIALGLPIAGSIIGLLITALILRATWQSWETIRHGYRPCEPASASSRHITGNH